MIRDAEFWMEARRKHNGGDAIFTAMLPMLHARQIVLDSGIEVDENDIGREDSAILSFPSKFVRKEPFEDNKVIHLPNLNASGKKVSSLVLRVLQQIMMFAVPLYSLQYNIPAMSMSWRTSCVVDRTTKQLITFGAGDGVKVPKQLLCRGCVATDEFFAILTDQGEVWVSGGLSVLSLENGKWTAGPLGKTESMSTVAEKALLIVGHGTRLACVTRAFVVRPLSILSNPVKSVIPSRHVRFLDLGYGEDYYMVGIDSVLYKTIASKRTLGTPRRVMALSRTPVSRVSCGMGFCLIIDQNGHLYTLGRNKKGQLGNGQQQNARRKPYLQKSLCHHFFVMVAAGDAHSLALTSSGVVYAAGSNENGQLGLGKSIDVMLYFTPISLPSRCVGIAAGPAGSMFACEDGRVYVCGLNDQKQLGLDTSARIVYTPCFIPVIATGVEAYTMDFGAYQKPVITTRNSVLSSCQPNDSSAAVTNPEETLPQVIPSELLGASVVSDANRHKQFEQTQLPRKEKNGKCAKCCATM
ncbi:hypothetical protein MOQ_002586 [Trypanosoma cruzi marinkellei]|uniref:Regulator of chromosome condensation (RCC1) n=1 Tax=Trypanosoma cruzi marinkellei TaxID=85056 RepID=K2ME99_TRYCR|nr:hypothetical protein MOQ_002586 [Trypanosoma cruzi marinkellei]